MTDNTTVRGAGLVNRADVIFDEEGKYNTDHLKTVLEILEAEFDTEAWNEDIKEYGLCDATSDVDYLKIQIKNAIELRKKEWDQHMSKQNPKRHTCDKWEIDEGYLAHPDLEESDKLDYISQAKIKRCITCLWHDGEACVNPDVV